MVALSSKLNLIISHNKATLIYLGFNSLILQNNQLLSYNNPSSTTSYASKLHLLPSSTICAVAKTVPSHVELDQQSSKLSKSSLISSSWAEFAEKVSGEWDGFGADFTTEGNPIELPESVVPQAYREWEVKVFDWQTQCPTFADPLNFHLSYKSIKLLPTVGCEADAATIYSSDERVIGVEESKNILAYAFQSSGCYVALYSVEETEMYKVFELEHSLIDPRDKESRVRVIQKLRLEGVKLKLQNIKVFCELWYGPFRNGDQLGGCAIRDSAFASTPTLNVSDVAGVWQSQDALASYLNSQNTVLEELVETSTQKIVRNENEMIMLPRQLWCSLKEVGDGETCVEVGWLLDPGFAISSRCIFSSDGKLKEMALGHETAAVN